MAQSKVFIKTDLANLDIEQMVSTFERVHYNPYFKTSKKEFDDIKDSLKSNWISDSISLKEFIRVGMKLSAILSGGHSYLHWKNPFIIEEIKDYKYIPFMGKLDINNQSFVVTKSMHPEIIPGSIIETINDINIDELFLESMTYIGGINSFKMAQTEIAFPLYLFFNEKLSPPYKVKMKGLNNTISLEGINLSGLAELLNSEQVQVDYSFEVISDSIGLISYNSCNNYKKFKKFLNKSFQTIHDKKINKLIIDIRQNGGGNSSLNDLLLAYLTREAYQQSSGRYWKVSEEAKNAYSENKIYEKIFGKAFMDEYMHTKNQEVIETLDSSSLTYPKKPKNYFEGKSCILIGPRTFSSANFLADAVKTYKISTLIGTPTGEYTNDFGEQLSFTLPNTACKVYISSTFDIGANGNKSLLEPVYPDIIVERDVLKYVLNWIISD